MNMKRPKFIHHTLFLAALALASWSLSSCYKEPFYKCIIIVTDSTDNPLAGAEVRVFAPVTGAVIGDTTLTDASGQASFEFPNEAVFNVEAEFLGVIGTGFIKLEPRETVVETVVIPR